jgi:hypothetical protein
MKAVCDTVAERVAAGEPLSTEEADHVGRCVDCAHLTEVPRLLAAVAREPVPAAGFAVRMQVGARQRMAARKRGRIAMTAAAAAAVMVAGTIAVTRPGASRIDPNATTNQQDPIEHDPTPIVERAATNTEKLVLDLVRVSDVDSVLEGDAPWDEITRPLDPYRTLLISEDARKGTHR